MVEDADAENMRDAFSGVVDDVPDETETVTTFGNIKNPTTEKEVSKFVNLFSDRLKTIEAEVTSRTTRSVRRTHRGPARAVSVLAMVSRNVKPATCIHLC